MALHSSDCGYIPEDVALTPQWDAMPIKTAADQRRFIDETRQRLARWTQDE